jgi:hypothetical protein
VLLTVTELTIARTVCLPPHGCRVSRACGSRIPSNINTQKKIDIDTTAVPQQQKNFVNSAQRTALLAPEKIRQLTAPAKF